MNYFASFINHGLPDAQLYFFLTHAENMNWFINLEPSTTISAELDLLMVYIEESD